MRFGCIYDSLKVVVWSYGNGLCDGFFVFSVKSILDYNVYVAFVGLEVTDDGGKLVLLYGDG